MIEDITQRLKDRVPELHGRVEGALQLVDLIKKGRLPQRFTALVFPNSLRGQKPNQATGMFIQAVSEGFSVVLVIPTTDGADRDVLGKFDTQIRTVASALLGWSPQGVTGVIQLDRGQIRSFHQGRVVYELAFSVDDQLRVTP